MSKKQKLREIWEADPEFPVKETADKLDLDQQQKFQPPYCNRK
jgi:hypothetical protein